MKVETYQKTKGDKRLTRVVLLAESDKDHEFLKTIIDYLNNQEQKIDIQNNEN